MIPSALGAIVLEEWQRSSALRRELEHVAVGLMPNHLHGIVVLNPGPPEGDDTGSHTDSPNAKSVEPRMRRASRSLGAFVGGFKAASTSRIRASLGNTGIAVWQRGYHEHLIRTDTAMVRIANYISTNPLRWDLDPENLERTAADDFDDWLLADTR